MKKVTLKTEWASLSLADDGAAIVCAKSNGEPLCVLFESLERVGQAISSKRISVKKWAVAVPRSLCILKTVALPAANLAEAAKMIEFELPSLIPLSMDEVVYGCTLLNQDQNTLNALVCILKLNTLEEHLVACRAAGIQPRKITLDSLAMQNWLNASGSIGPEPVISAVVSEGRCVVQTCIDGNFQRANELTLSLSDVPQAAREISREILDQREHLPQTLKASAVVLLVGSQERVSEVKGLLSSGHPAVVSKVEVASLHCPKFVCYGAEGKAEPHSDKYTADAIIAAGLLELVVNLKLPYSNLLPQQYARKYQQRAILVRHLLTASLLVLLMLLSWLYLVAANWRAEKKCRAIEAQIAPIKDAAGWVGSKHERLKAIQRQVANRGQIAQIIDELYRYTPKTISINQLTYSSKPGGASVEIKGQADQLFTVYEYTEAVREAKILSRIDIGDATQIPRPGGSIAVFKAKCDIPSE
jgi:type II secretory pathway component PulL